MIRYYVVVYREGAERQRLGPYPLRRAQRLVAKYLAAGRGAIVRAVDEQPSPRRVG